MTVVEGRIAGTTPDGYLCSPFSVGDLDGDGDDEVVGMNNLFLGPGEIKVFGEAPQKLTFDVDSVSAATGGTVTLTVSLDPARANRPVILVDSLRISQTGTEIQGARIWLDHPVFLSLFQPNLFRLDANGQGTAQVTFPPLPSVLVRLEILTQGAAAVATGVLEATGIEGVRIDS